MEKDPAELRKRNWRAIGSKLLVVMTGAFLILGAVAFLGLRKFELAVAFHPEKLAPSIAPPNGAQDVWFTNQNGNRLNGWYFQAKAPIATLIYFHGNGGNIANVGSLGERLASRGFNVLLFDYRGFGRSEGYLENEDGLYADADAAYEYLSRERGTAANSIAFYGHSLGTTAAVDLAARRGCAALVLESGPSSGADMARVVLPWLPRPFFFLARNRFDSARKLSQVSCPVLIAHGALDQTIPPEQARTLFAAAHEPKRLVMLPGTDHNVVGSANDQYFDLLGEFVRNAVSRQ